MIHAKRLLAATAVAVVTGIFAIDASAACRTCGTVVDVKTIKKEGEASGAGAILGGIAGGVLGHQIGSGRGNTAATVAGAAGGAYAGHQIEKSRNARTTYEVVVKMENGRHRTFTYRERPRYRVGDEVRVVDHKLRRR